MHVKKLTGKLCYLSPLSQEDASLFTKWLNDLEITKNLLVLSHQITLEGEKSFIQSNQNGADYVFSIIDFKTDTLIGTCSLNGIDTINRNAEFGIFIGNKSYHRKGYGLEALYLTLDFGFNILNLHQISLKVYEYNQAGICLYKKAGFKETGRKRESLLVCGRYYDMIYMDILENEYQSVYIKQVFIREQ